MAKHSNVYYLYTKIGDKTGFEAVEKATGCKNSYGLDLFKYKGSVYEGRTGCKFITEAELPDIDFKMKSIGGVEGFNKLVDNLLPQTGESPRYTRPDERKKDIFPPDPAKENIVFAKDSYGKRHYFFRFDYDGIELFTLKNAKDYFRTVFVQCEGYMLAIDQHHRLEEVKKWLAGLDNGVKGEVERLFNESMANPQKWADIGFANILGRIDEAKAHNAPIREARERENQQRDAEREASHAAEEQAAKEEHDREIKAAKDEYDRAIKAAENTILNKQTLYNAEIQGKSLIMQLFREHEIAVPLKTQGWIIKSLHDVYFHEGDGEWSYHYIGKPSTVFEGYMAQLAAAVQTKQQYEEMSQNGGDEPPLDVQTEQEDENDAEI